MKNAIRKMKWGIVALGLLLGLGLGLGLRADIKYFWLDRPSGRTNPNDPMSPLYSSPTPRVQAGQKTPTVTPTQTPQQSPTNSPTYTPQQSATDSPTPSPTPTDSPTPQAGGWPDVFGTLNGSAVYLSTSSGTNFINNGAGYASASQVNGAGPGSDTFYATLSLSCAAGVYSAVGEFTTGYSASGARVTQNASAYQSLSISVELVNNNDVPAVALVTDAGGNTKISIAVSVEPYMLGGVTFMSTGIWYTAVVPLSAFTTGEDGTGWNGQAAAASDTITATDMAAVVGVEVLPTSYDMSPVASSPNPPPPAGGLPLTTYNVDDIIFNNSATPTLSSDFAPGQAVYGETAVFADFEHGGQTNWGDYWATWNDGDADDAASPSSGFYGICTGTGSVSTRSFPVCTNCPVTGSPSLATINPPIDGAEGSGAAGGPTTPSNFGHIAGTVGSESGGTDCGAGNTLYAFWGMSAYFLASHATANILQILQVGQATPNCSACTAPAYGTNPRPTGIQLDIKAGPSDSNCPTNCEKYYMMLTYAGQPDSNGPATELVPTTSWQTVQIPFPAPASMTTTTAVALPKGSGATGTYDQGQFSMASWDGTAVTWDYSGTTTDVLANLQQLKISADNRGVPMDLEIDNIRFYYGTSTGLASPALRRPLR